MAGEVEVVTSEVESTIATKPAPTILVKGGPDVMEVDSLKILEVAISTIDQGKSEVWRDLWKHRLTASKFRAVLSPIKRNR